MGQASWIHTAQSPTLCAQLWVAPLGFFSASVCQRACFRNRMQKGQWMALHGVWLNSICMQWSVGAVRVWYKKEMQSNVKTK